MYSLAMPSFKNVNFTKYWAFYLIAFLLGMFVSYVFMIGRPTTVMVDSTVKPRIATTKEGMKHSPHATKREKNK